jgi:hypothetical protein
MNLGEGKHLLTLERDLDYFSGLAADKLGDAALAKHYWTAAAVPLSTPNVHSYFQALSLRALNDETKARTTLNELAQFADTLRKTTPKIDYFATSLPNLLLFEDDLEKRNRVEAMLLHALATDGLGDSFVALKELESVLHEDPNHLFAQEMIHWLKLRNPVLTARA